MLTISFIMVLGGTTVSGSLMNRIGIRLGGKAYHERGRSHEHQARVPWAVKQMREDLLAEQDKQHWRNSRNSEYIGII